KHGATTVAEVAKTSQLSRTSVFLEVDRLQLRELISVSTDDDPKITLNEFVGLHIYDEGDSEEANVHGVEMLREALGEVASAVRVVDDSQAWRGIHAGDFLLCDSYGDTVGVFRRLGG